MTLEVVSGVIIRDGRILLTQRKATQDFPFHWESPGGKVEGMGESHHSALRRELEEEVGLTSVDIAMQPLWTGKIKRQRAEDGYAYVHLYRCESTPVGGLLQEPKPLEGQGIGWFAANELQVLLLAPANALARALLFRAVCQSEQKIGPAQRSKVGL
jgi:mutator protein MutT